MNRKLLILKKKISSPEANYGLEKMFVPLGTENDNRRPLCNQQKHGKARFRAVERD